ncbi:MAG: hypothetical protein JWN08_796 [Frankiales bacterium]|nr:hypothetical protein [Frankiales bacterium]
MALPALVIGAVGLAHPIFLEPDSAERWRLAHLLLLPAFPLLAVSVFVLLRGERGPAAWGARVLSLAYAVLYGALDSIAGIGAPQQVIRAQERGEGRPPIGDLYEIGDQLGELGVYAFAAAGALTALVLYLRSRSPLAPVGGAVVVAASYPFLRHHVFPPRGVLAMVAIAVGLGLLELSRRERAA